LSATAIGIVIFSFYLVAIVVLGLIASRYQETGADFWVAGRRFGLGVMVMANMAAVMHGGAILSGVAFTAKFGGVAILPYISFVCGSAVVFYLFAKKLRQSGGFTIPITWVTDSTAVACEPGAQSWWRYQVLFT